MLTLVRRYFHRDSPNGFEDLPEDRRPFHGELLSIEGLDALAKALAPRLTRVVQSRRGTRRFFSRRDNNDRNLRHAYRTLAGDVRSAGVPESDSTGDQGRRVKWPNP